MTAGADLPPEFVAPEDWAPDQVAQFEAEWDRLTSDPAFAQQVRILPPGRSLAPVTHIAGPDVQVGSLLRSAVPGAARS